MYSSSELKTQILRQKSARIKINTIKPDDDSQELLYNSTYLTMIVENILKHTYDIMIIFQLIITYNPYYKSSITDII